MVDKKERICLCANNLVSYFENVEVYQIDVALAILAREYKGVQNNGSNVVLEIKEVDMNEIEMLGNLTDAETQGRRVYSTDGICPTLLGGMEKGNTVPYIIEAECLRYVRTDEGKQNRKAYEQHQLEQKYLEGKELDIRGDECCGTITTHQKDNPIITAKEVEYIGDWVWRKNDRFFQVEMRRLSPRECFRLMSFTDEDYEAAEKVTSKSQLLKQAGNSICEEVLQAIFRQMIPKECRNE